MNVLFTLHLSNLHNLVEPFEDTRYHRRTPNPEYLHLEDLSERFFFALRTLAATELSLCDIPQGNSLYNIL